MLVRHQIYRIGENDRCSPELSIHAGTNNLPADGIRTFGHPLVMLAQHPNAMRYAVHFDATDIALAPRYGPCSLHSAPHSSSELFLFRVACQELECVFVGDDVSWPARHDFLGRLRGHRFRRGNGGELVCIERRPFTRFEATDIALAQVHTNAVDEIGILQQGIEALVYLG